MHTPTRTRLTFALALGAAALASALPGCRGDRAEKPPRRFLPDMDQQPRWNPQDGSDFFVDGRTSRTPDPRTVAYGATDWAPGAFADLGWASSFADERRSILADNDAYHRGIDPATGQAVVYAPVEIDAELVARGQDRFNIYCSVCHGYAGDGKGIVGLKWSYYPADLSTGVYVDRNDPKGTDGHLFDVIRNGVWGPDGANLMPSYGHALDEHDAWAVVAYLRVLQRANNATLDDVPPAERERLRASRGAAPTEGEG